MSLLKSFKEQAQVAGALLGWTPKKTAPAKKVAATAAPTPYARVVNSEAPARRQRELTDAANRRAEDADMEALAVEHAARMKAASVVGEQRLLEEEAQPAPRRAPRPAPEEDYLDYRYPEEMYSRKSVGGAIESVSAVVNVVDPSRVDEYKRPFPVAGVKISVGAVTKTTDKKGIAVFDKAPVKDGKVKIQMHGAFLQWLPESGEVAVPEWGSAEATFKLKRWAWVVNFWPWLIGVVTIMALLLGWVFYPQVVMKHLSNVASDGLLVVGTAWGAIVAGFGINMMESALKGEFKRLGEDYWASPALFGVLYYHNEIQAFLRSFLKEESHVAVAMAIMYLIPIIMLIVAMVIQREQKQIDLSPLLPLCLGVLVTQYLDFREYPGLITLASGIGLIGAMIYESRKLIAWAVVGGVMALAIVIAASFAWYWAITVEALCLLVMSVAGIVSWNSRRLQTEADKWKGKAVEYFPVVCLEVALPLTVALILVAQYLVTNVLPAYVR